MEAFALKGARVPPGAAAEPGGVSSLPDLSALTLGPHHRISSLTAERLGEGGDIRERTVGPEFGRGVGIHVDHEAFKLRTCFRSPDLRPGQKESLIAGQPIYGCRLLFPK